MIVLRNVTKTYAAGKEALRGITLAVPRGEFVFLVGGNGAGKSTLLKLLVRAETASSGVVMVAGNDLGQLPERKVPAFRQQIGIVFQDIRLFADKTIFENVAFSLQVTASAGIFGNTRERVMQALELVGLAAHARRFPAQMSGGEQQRAAIARAIVRSPHILIADEPTANLPPDASWQIIQLLAEINQRGVTTLVATHDRDVVDGLKRRVVELADGRIVRDQRYGRFTPAAAAALLSPAATAGTGASSAYFPVVAPTGPTVATASAHATAHVPARAPYPSAAAAASAPTRRGR